MQFGRSQMLRIICYFIPIFVLQFGRFVAN